MSVRGMFKVYDTIAISEIWDQTTDNYGGAYTTSFPSLSLAFPQQKPGLDEFAPKVDCAATAGQF